MEYTEGVSGQNMTLEMFEWSAEELGHFQGRLHVEKPRFLESISNLSEVDFLKNYYINYRSWKELYDYIRSDNIEIPKHIFNMLINLDKNSDTIWERSEKLPIVLCHRDF